MQYEWTRKVLAALEAQNVDYVIFGGVAINLLGLARTTRDLSIMIRADRANVERMKAALTSVFHDPHVAEISADDLLGDYPAVQYIPPVEGFHVDVLTRLGEAFDFQSIESARLSFDGIEVCVATPAALYEMKRDTVRWKDKADAQALRVRFGLEDD